MADDDGAARHRGPRVPPALLCLCLPIGSSLAAQGQDTASAALHSWRVTLPYRQGVVIWVANSGQDSVRIRAVTVSRCLNIGAGCGTTPLALQLGPGDSAAALTIRPKVWDDRYVYTLSWEWETSSAAEPAP